MKAWKTFSEQCGGVVIVVAVSTVMLLSFAALVVDIGYGLVVKNQLHNVADSAALAGTRQLGRIYCPELDPVNPCIPYAQQQSYVLTSADRAAIVAEVQDTASKNAAGGVSISVDAADIRIGDWDIPARTLTVTDTRPTAVEVTARRDGTPNGNGPITTFLANIMGVSSLSVRATSIRNGQPEEPTAALTGVSYAPPGELDIPVAISRQWFTGGDGVFCGQSIKFSPTTDPEACGGWTTFTDPKANDPIIQDILNGLRTETYQTPGVIAGETELTMINGDLSTPTFDALEALYNAKKDADGTWKTFVPVYDSDTCHPNKSEELIVKGFATVLITQVLGAPDKLIQGTVLCDVVEPARGGGAAFGTLGSIPGLVQ